MAGLKMSTIQPKPEFNSTQWTILTINCSGSVYITTNTTFSTKLLGSFKKMIISPYRGIPLLETLEV